MKNGINTFFNIHNSLWLPTILIVQLWVNVVCSQSNSIFVGHIYNASTYEPVPYANIFNYTSQQGTISNENGYFKIPILSPSDSIIVSCVGFLEQLIIPSLSVSNYEIFLKENILSISEVTITPEENDYLYTLLVQCKPSKKSSLNSSKAYLSLKTFKEGHQVELLESYYNATLQGSELQNLNIKTGRLALQTIDGSFFVSLSSSKAIAMLNLFNKNNQFPTNPMELSATKMKKTFHLSLNQAYVDNNQDSIYLIEYFPKSRSGDFFRGSIWINAAEKYIMKITLNSNEAAKAPFQALYTDKLIKTNFNITKTFIRHDHQSFLNHIDFVYEVEYEHGIGRLNTTGKRYLVRTESVLYFYDYNQAFNLPQMGDQFEDLDDYRQISALPYIPFFWENHTEYKLDDSMDTNNAFFNDSFSITNESWFLPKGLLDKFKHGFYEHPFIRWSNNRIKISEMSIDTVLKTPSNKTNSEKYHFEVILFMDINTYGDSTHITTDVIIDPFHSYYFLPVDTLTLCFANIYFDLCEIERRKLHMELEAVGNDIIQVESIYQNARNGMYLILDEYKKEVIRGRDISILTYYNNYVKENLGIDNMKLFGFKKETEN